MVCDGVISTPYDVWCRTKRTTQRIAKRVARCRAVAGAGFGEAQCLSGARSVISTPHGAAQSYGRRVARATRY